MQAERRYRACETSSIRKFNRTCSRNTNNDLALRNIDDLDASLPNPCHRINGFVFSFNDDVATPFHTINARDSRLIRCCPRRSTYEYLFLRSFQIVSSWMLEVPS